ncbi:MAG TPA: DedA family protein [Candidatus Moranbacteria bacterium]|jgi:undecaprenyl-diphosphatase|nr:DedA family protein [Candidatus Moranbacteria bacterium]HOF42230.1 DedA family protein [Candidatus Moranbacteria bacterium]HPX94371.1 DedA family protein [Candidatus Moranbacteria bacterium]HQB59500.1 DedA family protein [Candidatus Moranbacteria bacterium]
MHVLDFQNYFENFGMIIHLLKECSYFGIFFLGVVVAYLIPIPEIVVLMLFGFAARVTGLDLVFVFASATAGIIVGDNVAYRLSFMGHRYVEKFNKKIREHELTKYENLVVSHIGKAIYFLRFVTGIRFFGPVISGALGVKWRDFFFFNMTANILHTLLFISIGYFTGKSIMVTIAEVEIVRNILMLSSVFIIGVLLSVFSKRKKPKPEELGREN